LSSHIDRAHHDYNREAPRVMMIYDIMDKPVEDVRKSIRNHFYKHKDIKDERVINMLLETGYYHLEDTLLQHKQKNHLLNLLDGTEGGDLTKKTLTKNSSPDEQFYRGFK
jgi:Complex 1 protein (LYR family)